MGKGAELNCGESCMKYLLFFFNFLFFIFGAVLLALGCWLRFDPNMASAKDISPDVNTFHVFYFIIALGVFVFILGFLGCVGACCENKCMLGTYAAIIICLIVLQVAAAIFAGVYRKKFSKGLKDEMKNQVTNEYGDAQYAGLTKSWDQIQESLKCCGADGPADYEGSSWQTGSSSAQHVPASCCANQASGATDCATSSAYTTGCYKAFDSKLHNYLGIIIGVCIGIVLIEILSVIFACTVMKKIV